jgi:pSer/pThr/pTyr-binding forkhead associated (FHA) protein
MRHHFRLIDLGATHGTSVNGQSIQSARLADGDLIALGEAVFRFESMYGRACCRVCGRGSLLVRRLA